MSAFDPARVERAVDEGYEAGHAAGRAEALAAAQERIDAEIQRFRTEAQGLLASLAATTDRVGAAEVATAQAFAATVADAAVQLARAVIGRELSDETVAATAAVDRVLASLGRREKIWVQLHPEDLELLDGAEVPHNVVLEANPGLGRGDAVAHTDDRTVDARIATALDRARVELERVT